MSYDKSRRETSSSRSSLSDLEECPLNPDEQPLQASSSLFPLKQRKRVLWPSNESPFWKYYSLFTTTCCVILLLTLVHDKTSRQSMRTATTPSQSSIASASTPVPQEFGNALAKYPHEVDRWNRDKLIETKYYRDTRYMSIDHEYDYLWQEHQFMSTGNVRIPGENGKNASLMSISMFHQMHCLATMRVALQHAREGLIDIGVDWRDDAHWPHCFDYLRSTIMCYADGTLEQVTQQPGPNDDGKVVKVIDGGVETRHCRDTRPLYQLERQYGPHSQYGHENDDFQVAPGR